MPFYEYRCEKCETQIELFHGINEDARTECESCHEHTLKRVVFPSAVIYKGSGYYTTEYKKSSAPKSESSSSSSDTKTESKSETKAESTAETKSEAKTESKPAPAKETAATA